MAKIPFSKLKLKKNTEFSTVEWKIDEDTIFNIDYYNKEDKLGLFLLNHYHYTKIGGKVND